MKSIPILSALLLGFCPTLRAQATPAVFDNLEGVWSGTGTLFGQPAVFDMNWKSEHGLYLLSFSSGMMDEVGKRTAVISSLAIYRPEVATPRGVWEDSRRIQVNISWEATDSVLTSNWTAPEESGRTIYRILPDGRVEVVDEVFRNGGLAVFGIAEYRRVTR